MYNYSYSMKKGFTLVELSIVLVIIGLLIGGILIGQSLISSAKINGVIREQSQYVAAIRLFHAQFKGLPGDSSYAARVLGVGNPALAAFDDGAISWGGDPEGYWAWRQMSFARFIKNDAKTADGHYSGTSLSGGFVEPGINAPFSKVFGKAVWFLEGAPRAWGPVWNLNWSPGTNNFGRSLIRLAEDMAGPGGTKYPSPWNGPLNVQQLAAIDAKLDDGKPGSGEVMAHVSQAGPIYGCSTTTVSATAEYDFSQEGNVCHVVFWLPNF